MSRATIAWYVAGSAFLFMTFWLGMSARYQLGSDPIFGVLGDNWQLYNFATILFQIVPWLCAVVALFAAVILRSRSLSWRFLVLTIVSGDLLLRFVAPFVFGYWFPTPWPVEALLAYGAIAVVSLRVPDPGATVFIVRWGAVSLAIASIVVSLRASFPPIAVAGGVALGLAFLALAIAIARTGGYDPIDDVAVAT